MRIANCQLPISDSKQAVAGRLPTFPLPIANRQLAILILLLTPSVLAQSKPTIDKLTDQPDAWFTGEGKAIVDNILTWQNKNGGWWKAYDLTVPDPEYVEKNGKKSGHDSGFDNGATYSELRILARAVRITKEPRYQAAFERGLRFVIDSQYPNGGWPQRLPIKPNNYSRHITFNDDAMVNVMQLLKEIIDGKPDFVFVSDADRKRCKEVFDRGVECILRCQIRVGDKLTAWCQQHDAETLLPIHARAYELPSICAAESTGIVMLLMSIDKPDPDVRQAIDSAIIWFESSKIVGKRYERVRKPGESKVTSVVFEDDPAAPPLWARFYDIDTNQPFFCDRDGVKKWSLDEIGKERRLGYAWYTTRPNEALTAYAQWKFRWNIQSD